MDGTTTMQGTEQEVQNTATETQGQQTAESTPEKVSTLQKFIDGLFGGGKKAEGAEPEKKDGDPAAEKAEEEKSFTQADVDAAIEAAKQQWLDEAVELVDRIKGKESGLEVPGSGKTKGTAKGFIGSVTVAIAKLADEIIVREDADIDEIADKVAKKVVEVVVNMG